MEMFRLKAIESVKVGQNSDGKKNYDYCPTVVHHLGRCLSQLHQMCSFLSDPLRYASDCGEDEKSFGIEYKTRHITNAPVESWHNCVKNNILKKPNLAPWEVARLMEPAINHRLVQLQNDLSQRMPSATASVRPRQMKQTNQHLYFDSNSEISSDDEDRRKRKELTAKKSQSKTPVRIDEPMEEITPELVDVQSQTGQEMRNASAEKETGQEMGSGFAEKQTGQEMGSGFAEKQTGQEMGSGSVEKQTGHEMGSGFAEKQTSQEMGSGSVEKQTGHEMPRASVQKRIGQEIESASVPPKKKKTRKKSDREKAELNPQPPTPPYKGKIKINKVNQQLLLRRNV